MNEPIKHLEESTGLNFTPAAHGQVIASIPDKTAKFNKRYGSGSDEPNALASLLLNATGRHAVLPIAAEIAGE